MKTLTITLPQPVVQYDIEYATSFELLNNALKNETRSFVIITDENVFSKSVFFKKYQNNIPDFICVLKAGEQYKNWESILRITNHFFKNALDRSSVVYAIGGGVVGDMTGFAASIFMRGIPFVQVPTTVLSMVDSSVGGKTGIDTPHGKNLLGTFHQPEKVLIIQSFLDSLPFCEVQNGLAEMIKHSIVADRFFEDLETFAEQYQNDFATQQISASAKKELFLRIYESVDIKKQIVETDEKEKGIRAWLNVGHTFGHAIEHLSNFSIPHGLSVAKGIMLALKESKKQNILKEDTLFQRTQKIFDMLQIDTSCPFDEHALLKAMQHDKKKQNKQIYVILPEKKGKMIKTTYPASL